MSFGQVAASLASSWRPVALPDTFDSVRSTEAAQLLGVIPSQNAAQQWQMANNTLTAAGELKRQQMMIDAQAQLLDAELADRGNARRLTRRDSLLRMAGDLLVRNALQPQSSPFTAPNPLDAVTAMNSFFAQQRADLASRSAGSRAFAATALPSLTTS